MIQQVESIATPTMDQKGRRRWLYPDRRAGKYASRRRATAFGLIIFYLVIPHLRWNGLPLMRFDVYENKAYFFGQVFRINEASILSPMLAGAAILLLFATSLKGRIWCSYGCPQTVFVDWVVRPIEEFIEGPAHHRRRIDGEGFTWQRTFKKILKHLAFLIVSAIVANTFLSFFVGPDHILEWMTRSPLEHWYSFSVMMLILVVFYADLAWFREQFCAYLCPYARFQSVMMDVESPAVAYRADRGEPRGRGKEKGDCIDCQLCVRVCPTGIDIRNGLQLECVMCARCIDACNIVMKNLSRPPDLIGIASQNELAGLAARPFWQRPRVVAYGVILGLLSALIAVKVVGRPPVALSVTRAPGVTYTQLPNSRYGNMFLLTLSNNTDQSLPVRVVSKAPEVELLCSECERVLTPYSEHRVSIVLAFPHDWSNRRIELAEQKTERTIVVPLIGP